MDIWCIFKLSYISARVSMHKADELVINNNQYVYTLYQCERASQLYSTCGNLFQHILNVEVVMGAKFAACSMSGLTSM